MEYYFAKSNGFKVGDAISAKMPDGSHYEVKIEALVVSAETSIVKADPYSISSSRDFACIYVPKAAIDGHDSEPHFNQILYRFKDGEKKTLDQTVELLKQYIQEEAGIPITEEDIKHLRSNVAFATTYDDSEVITYYNDALKSINLITLSAPSVFFIVVMIVTALFLFQIVKQDDVVVQVIGDVVGEEGRVFSFHARQLCVGDFQSVIPQPGQHGEQHEQYPQRGGQIVKARQRPGSRGEKVDELRRKQRQNSPGKYLVDESAGHGRVEMLLQPGNQRDRPPFEK
jgi:hypothetical protein